MIERQGPLSLSRRCELLGLSRAALYYRAVKTGAYELEMMALIDRQYLQTPYDKRSAGILLAGNVSELSHAIQSAVILADGERLCVRDLPEHLLPSDSIGGDAAVLNRSICRRIVGIEGATGGILA
jgi:transcriptional regulator of acetoin/glycerol metabolism